MHPILCRCLLLGALCVAACRSAAPLPVVPLAEKPRNIILVIGDGMALSQVSAGVHWRGGLKKSAFSRFPVVGFHKSFSADDLITDSAAGATAFACGQKTNNGEIGMLPNRAGCQTILEDWAASGRGTGMVVTCTATHATPASFIAHQGMRAFTEQIALDYLRTPIDCVVAGGEFYFTTQRPDRLNLKDSLRERGYVIRSGTSFKKLPLDGSAPFMLFTAEREPPTASAGRTYLPRAAEMACNYLKKRRPQGFFLMVEGSQIDWGGHSNDRRWLEAEMIDFDRTLQRILDFAAADGETLVIVTGDHECGGLSLPEMNGNRREFRATFAARMHTGALVPVFAFGPRAEMFNGIYDNTAIYAKMKAAAP
jgi:alkaline phosphatase